MLAIASYHKLQSNENLIGQLILAERKEKQYLNVF